MVEESWEEEDTDSKEFVDEISESAEYSPKSDFSKAQIVYTQIEKCCLLRSEEMKAGYSTHIVDKIGNVKLVYIPDARKKFIGAVSALINLLMPEINRDSFCKESIEELKKIEENLKKKYAYKEKKIILNNGNRELALTGREYIPEIGEILVVGVKPISKGIMGENKIEGYWDSKVNSYYNELLEAYDTIFSELNCLIDKLNYFKQKMGF